MADDGDDTTKVDSSPGASITVATYDRPISPLRFETSHAQRLPDLGLDGTSEEHSPYLGPRRGSFPSDIPEGFTMPKSVIPQFPNLMRRISDGFGTAASSVTKNDIQATLSASLAPKSGFLPSQKMIPSSHDEQTDSDPEFKHSTPMMYNGLDGATGTKQLVNQPTSAPQSDMPPPRRGPKPGSRRAKQYTMDDGTIISGKGLGRGRPGIKRGPRSSKYGVEDAIVSESASPAATSASPGPSSQASKKRKRAASDASSTFSASASLSSLSRQSTPEYNPSGATRSGRVSQKPVAPVAPAETASPAAKRPKVQSANSTPNVVKHPKIKRRVYRGREQFALCDHCERGHGPIGNVIVFCDACNKCWHQNCHDPPIPQSTIADTKADWFCSDCNRILHGKKKQKKEKAPKATAQAAAADAAPLYTGPLIGGATLTVAQKVAYLESLTKPQLVKLVLQGADLAPALPMFQVAAPVLLAAKFTSSYTTPVSATPVYHTAAGAADADGDEDEGYETYVDEHALLYPKPGHGVRLPPEKDDMHMLLESKDSRTFSHWVRGRDTGKEYSGSGDINIANGSGTGVYPQATVQRRSVGSS